MKTLFLTTLLTLLTSSALAYSYMDDWQPPPPRHNSLAARAARENQEANILIYNAAIDAEHQTPPDYTTAVQKLQSAADDGFAPAQRELGRLYLKGQGVTQNNLTGLQLLQKASDQHDAVATYFIGMLYLKGFDGHFSDPAKAVPYLIAATDQDFGLNTLAKREAQRNLGILYLRGMGVQRDIIKAKEWLQKSADNGDRFSQLLLRTE